MADEKQIHELTDDKLIELIEHDPESERLLGGVETAVEGLREIAGKKDEPGTGSTKVETVTERGS